MSLNIYLRKGESAAFFLGSYEAAFLKFIVMFYTFSYSGFEPGCKKVGIYDNYVL